VPTSENDGVPTRHNANALLLPAQTKRSAPLQLLIPKVLSVEELISLAPVRGSRPVKWCKATSRSAGPSDGDALYEEVAEGRLGSPPGRRLKRRLGQVALVGGQPLVVLLGEERAAEADERLAGLPVDSRPPSPNGTSA
jgi:hypothetical protein